MWPASLMALALTVGARVLGMGVRAAVARLKEEMYRLGPASIVSAVWPEGLAMGNAAVDEVTANGKIGVMAEVVTS